MSLVVRKPVVGVFDQVPHKPGCTTTEDGERLEISDLGSRGIVLIRVVKTKALISFAKLQTIDRGYITLTDLRSYRCKHTTHRKRCYREKVGRTFQ